jgi:hypothetical protein
MLLAFRHSHPIYIIDYDKQLSDKKSYYNLSKIQAPAILLYF